MSNPDQAPEVKVLVVDDADSIRQRLQQILQSDGYAVYLAATFTEGVNAAKAAQKPFDAIVQDNSMPDAPLFGGIMSMGLELSNNQIPSGLVGFTGDPEDIRNAISAALDTMNLLRHHEVIAKHPFDANAILDAVARAAGLMP